MIEKIKYIIVYGGYVLYGTILGILVLIWVFLYYFFRNSPWFVFASVIVGALVLFSAIITIYYLIKKPPKAEGKDYSKIEIKEY